MTNFEFITETDVSSGKVASRSVRRTIRTHVMRTLKCSGVPLADGPPSPQRRSGKNKSSKTAAQPVRAREVTVSPKDIGTHSSSTDSGPSKGGSSAESRCAESTSYHLNRVTDAFIYAGSYIDIESYGFFTHYASEFNIVLYSQLHPIPPAKRNLCCSTAIQENFPALLHAICFTGAAHEAVARRVLSDPKELFRNPQSKSGVQQQALRHKSHSLSLLTRQLTHPSETAAITEAAILCVTILLAAEAIFGDDAALTAHANGLVRMIELFGGEDVLRPSTATQIHLADVKAAAVRQRSPSFPPRPHLRHRFANISATSFQPQNPAFSDLGSRFFYQPLSGQISPQLQQCLKYARHLITIAESYKDSAADSATLTIDDFITLEKCLLSLSSQLSLSPLEECIRLATLLYSNVALWKTPPYFGWVLSLIVQLKSALLLLDWQQVGQDCPEVLRWILVLGGHVASMQSQNEKAWWSGRLLDVELVLGVLDWDETTQIQDGFFPIERAWEGITRVIPVGAWKRGLRSLRHPCDYCE